MGRKRQTFSKNFKARVVLEALREESTIQEIAVKHGVHPNQVSQWKSQVIAGMEEIFERPNKKSQEVRQQEEKESEYLKTIGKQKVEIEFLKKKYRQSIHIMAIEGSGERWTEGGTTPRRLQYVG